MKVTIVYHSKRGKTAAYAREIALFCWQQGCDVRLSSVSDCKPEWQEDTSLWILGCWTSGYVLFGQKPSTLWRDFVSRMQPTGATPKVVLFATYKIRLGRMFSRMMRASASFTPEAEYCMLASRDGRLSEQDRESLLSCLHTQQENGNK